MALDDQNKMAQACQIMAQSVAEIYTVPMVSAPCPYALPAMPWFRPSERQGIGAGKEGRPRFLPPMEQGGQCPTNLSTNTIRGRTRRTDRWLTLLCLSSPPYPGFGEEKHDGEIAHLLNPLEGNSPAKRDEGIDGKAQNPARD